MKKITILHCLGWIASGGVEQRRLLLARMLSKRTFKHVAICQETNGHLPDLLREEGWDIHVIGKSRHVLDWEWHRRANNIAQRYAPDIVHGAVFEGVRLAVGVGMAMPRVKVIAEETSYPSNRSWRGNLFMRALCLRADRFVGVSPAVADYGRQVLRLPEGRIRSIPNAVASPAKPDDATCVRLRKNLGLAPGSQVIGAVGRIYDDVKRFSDLIRAFALCRNQARDLTLLIVGDGPDRSTLEDLVSKLGVSDSVRFVGYQADPAPYYHMMDLFVLPSAHEAFGLVLAEAMHAGVPVIGTSVGGIPYVLDQGAAGLLVPPKQPEALAAAIISLLDNEGERQRFALAGKARAESAFSADRYVADIERLYLELMQERRR